MTAVCGSSGPGLRGSAATSSAPTAGKKWKLPARHACRSHDISRQWRAVPVAAALRKQRGSAGHVSRSGWGDQCRSGLHLPRRCRNGARLQPEHELLDELHNRAKDFFFRERLDWQGKPLQVPHRATVQARQIYVLAQWLPSCGIFVRARTGTRVSHFR